MNEKRILVVGATSTVGGHVVEQLADAGGAVPVAGVRNAEKARPFQERGIATALLDLSEPSSVARALRGIDSVFLLTGYTVDMLAQSKLVVDRARDAGVRHIVHLGAWAPDDTDIAHFGWHQYVERYIEASGIAWTHLAPHMFMQNMLGASSLWSAFAGAGDAGSRPLHAFFGEGRVGWIAAEDIAAIAVAALHAPERHAGKKYDLSVEVASVQEVARTLAGALEHPFHAVLHAPEEFHAALLSGGMDAAYASSALDTLRRFRDGTVRGQESVFLFEDILGKRPLSWVDFARKHRGELLGARAGRAA